MNLKPIKTWKIIENKHEFVWQQTADYFSLYEDGKLSFSLKTKNKITIAKSREIVDQIIYLQGNDVDKSWLLEKEVLTDAFNA